MKTYCTANAGDCFTCPKSSYWQDCEKLPIPRQIGNFIICSSVSDVGWTPDGLAEALRGPLGALGVRVGVSYDPAVREGLNLDSKEISGVFKRALISRKVYEIVVDKIAQGDKKCNLY